MRQESLRISALLRESGARDIEASFKGINNPYENCLNLQMEVSVKRGLIQTVLALMAVLIAVQFAFAEKDVAGSKDPSLFTRMPGFYINQYEEKEFGSFDFLDKNGNSIRVEGQKIEASYAWPGSGKKPSSLQVIANYENAIKKIGGVVVYKKGDFFTTLKLVKDGRETWAQIESEVDAGWGGYILTIIQKGKMEQQVVANAAAMKADIRATGHVAVYGINFDTGKAEIKPESGPVIAEIAKLLTQDTGLKIHVVGHTDNVGGISSNLQLSQARAEAVKKMLVEKYKIQAGRLGTFGAGQFCPVDTNASPEGRAKNRRVELVQQ